MQVKKQQLELDMEQQTGSKQGKEYVKAAYCHPAYLTYMQSTSCKMPGSIPAQAGIKIAGRNINNLRYGDRAFLVAQMVKNPPALWETWVQFLGQEDPLEKEMAKPVQYSYLENSMDSGAWQATDHGVTKNQT